MANREHLAKLKEGVEAWNNWRKANLNITPDLSGADLGDKKLRDVNFSATSLYGADLSGANLSDATLSGANLNGANLSHANLNEALLNEAELTQADLSRASLTGAELTWAHLRGANLSRADLTGAFIGYTTFADNDLSDVKGLGAVLHGAPSTIGIDTIYRSHGNIPLKFLRGAGVPDNFIEYMGSLTGKTLGFYSCFISYSTKDQEFADRLYADLQNKGVRCWFAPYDIQAGKKIHEQIDEAIRTYDLLLLILSPNSMNSEWVKTEIRKARKRERTEKRRVLFPVRLVPFEAIRDWELLDAEEGKDLAKEIREYFIPDFSNWKRHDAYGEALLGLVRDLVSSAPSPPSAGRNR